MGVRVLLVKDDETLAEPLADGLRHCGLTVHHVAIGRGVVEGSARRFAGVAGRRRAGLKPAAVPRGTATAGRYGDCGQYGDRG